ncbi:DUF4345 family protein [Arenimonas sp.]|uniref:DUF4345 family protein n=1 Tax=Arenimonas sp. TaxID=1872635 RepID=UPI0039E38986
MTTFSRIVLLLAGLGFLGFGGWLAISPQTALEPLGVRASAAGWIELRAFYGGLELGLAIFLFMAAWHRRWRRAGLWVVMLGNAGIGLTRLACLGLGGQFTPYFGYALAWELGFALLAGWGLAHLPSRIVGPEPLSDAERGLV